MNIEVNYDRISRGLTRQLHNNVEERHNFVEVRMRVNRRTLHNLLQACKRTDFKRTGLQRGCRYFLSNGVVAERFDNELSMFRLEHARVVPVQTKVAELKSVFTDQPSVQLRVASKTHLTKVEESKILRREFEGRFVFVNARGYEYVMSVRTQCPSEGKQTLRDAELALAHSERQVNEFSIRFLLENYSHSTIYHALNTLHLFIQMFNPELKLALTTEDDNDDDEDEAAVAQAKEEEEETTQQDQHVAVSCY